MAFFFFFNDEWKVIRIPKSLKTDIEGFGFLTNLYYEIKGNKKVVLDFSECTWLEANLCAILGSIVHIYKNQKVQFKIENIDNQSFLKNTFENNGFLNLFEKRGNLPIDKRHSGIPFSIYDMKNENEFEDYIYKYILSASKIPEMSEGAKRKIFRSIFELFQNSVMHSGAEELYVCGQYYTNKGRMALTMVEYGNTFKQNVSNHSPNYINYSGVDCLNWAVKSGNTTKSKTEAGGLGLDIIREFLKLNQGKLQINSADGYWEEKKGAIFVSECEYDFPGSIVNIEFNLRDKNSYITKEELNISDIL
jgi:hypothetical protein